MAAEGFAEQLPLNKTGIDSNTTQMMFLIDPPSRGWKITYTARQPVSTDRNSDAQHAPASHGWTGCNGL